jgi:hypothetical protein
MNTHSPLPWRPYNQIGSRILNSWWIADSKDKGIVNAVSQNSPEETYANAQFIVTAVNSHAALVGALENIVSEWERQKRLFPILAKDGWMEECMAKANAVLAKLGCADCDMAEDEDGKWTLYAGGITVKP